MEKLEEGICDMLALLGMQDLEHEVSNATSHKDPS